MRVFQVSDCDWWLAETADQARDAAIEFYGGDDCVSELDEVVEVPDDELERLQFHDEDDDTSRSFKEQVAKRIKEGANKPELFASTEY
jgi:hypothetical protein